MGDVKAIERVELRAGASVLGDITSPRLMMADGGR